MPRDSRAAQSLSGHHLGFPYAIHKIILSPQESFFKSLLLYFLCAGVVLHAEATCVRKVCSVAESCWFFTSLTCQKTKVLGVPAGKQ